MFIGQWLLSIDGIFTKNLAEPSWPISCNLWHRWSISIVGNL